MAKFNPLIYGKNSIPGIVSIDIKDSVVYLYKNDGTHEVRRFKPWLLTTQPLPNSRKLHGNLPLAYFREYDTKRGYFEGLRMIKDAGMDRLKVRNDVEAFMIRNGYTLYKGLKFEEISILSFDIETTTLEHKPDSRVLLISNTFRSMSGEVERKLFAVDEYSDECAMIAAWCTWVRQINPSILCGHNIFSFDLPYLQFRSKHGLRLGRDNSFMQVDNFERYFRKDGSQSYTYNNIEIFGRQIIDTFFLAMKYDIGRKYTSYSLKNIIKDEGLEKPGRQHYDAWQIKRNWDIPEERVKIKNYAIDDADDSLALYDLMAPSFFYYTQHLPMTFQWVNNTATGRQINNFLARSYLQLDASLPIPSMYRHYEGGISFGNSGIYYNVVKVDVASMYPSIMITDEIHDPVKDPYKHFLKMVQFFTTERLKNKATAKRTGEKFYKDLEQSQKIFINSAYGMLGAKSLNFNSPDNAAKVTTKGREILSKGIAWVKENGYSLVNVDTDSFSYTKNKPISQGEVDNDLAAINAMYPPGIRWEKDGKGLFDCMIVFKAKNYVIYDGENLMIKGSSLKDQKKEPALREFMERAIWSIVKDKTSELPLLYNEYVEEILDIKDINRWATKKTVTAKVLTSERTNEVNIKEAIGDKFVQEGDKIWLYPSTTGLVQATAKGRPVFYKNGEPKMVEGKALKLVENWIEGDVDVEHLLKRLYDTIKIMSNVVDLNLFTNYSLKRNKEMLKEIFPTQFGLTAS